MCNVNYEWYKKHNICVKCGQEDSVRNHVLCFRCMIKSRESSKIYANKHKEERKEKCRINNKDRYYKLKELGICTMCGKRKTKNNKIYCEYCRTKENAKKRKQYLLNIYAVKNMSEIRV